MWLYHKNDDIDVRCNRGNSCGRKDDRDREAILRCIFFDGTRSALEKVKSSMMQYDIECNPFTGTCIQKKINRLEDGEPSRQN